MPPEAAREGRDWFTRAERDLAAADSLLNGPVRLPDIVVYHCQQAAEKAYLAARDEALPRTHNLPLLVELCQAVAERFSELGEAARGLTPYAEQFRYPGGPLEPALAEADEALRLAHEIVDYVRSRL